MRYGPIVSVFVSLFVLSNAVGQTPPEQLLGRWDITMRGASGEFPSWMEVRKSGNTTLVGDFVGQFGSARPIAKITLEDGAFRFVIPPQWEPRTSDLVIEGQLSKNAISGETTDDQGRSVKFLGRRAPDLIRDAQPTWGEPIELFNGQDLAGWESLLPGVENGWVVKDGLLYNQKPGQNIATTQKFMDFKLHAEFRYPKGSNSGIYLRGRYEAQVEDNFGDEAESHKIGGIYGHLTPSSNAAKRHGEWQTYDIELVGRKITIYLNGERVIDRATIPGITGGALDSNEGDSGPIYLQGDHGPVWFRKLTLTPAQ
jgi:hypothetical protein